MKTILTTILMSAALAAHAGQAKLGPASRVWLEGDSTLHPFASTAAAVEFALTLDSAKPFAEAAKEGAPAKLSLKIPVAALKSAHKGLDENLQKALDAKKNPDIVFLASHYAVEGDKISVTGELTVAGTTKERTVVGVLGPKGLDGSHELKMTDFGVKPPKLMLGAVKVADKILVRFHLELTDGN